MRYKEFKPNQFTAKQTAKIKAIQQRVADSEKKSFIPAPAHMQAGFDYDDEQWGYQLELELQNAKKRYLQSVLNDAKAQQPNIVLKDEKKNRGLVANMAKRAVRKKR